MKATIRLFKAVPITAKKKKKPTKVLLDKTISKGFVFAPEVIANYSEKELDSFITIIEKEVGLTKEQMNSAFHKSWNKVKTASMEQLIMEQLVHYFTTYGFESLGIYDKSHVFIPIEKLEIPDLDTKGIDLVVIKGYTKKELKFKLMNMLCSGIALGEDTVNDVVEVAIFVKVDEKDIDSIKNKEVKVALYDNLKLFPENPTEFLRYCIYKSVEKTLLIKDKGTIKQIKEKDNNVVLRLLLRYKRKDGCGYERLAEIFYRFKPLFLAFRTDSQLKSIINKIRKLAKKNHKPMKEDYLNEITSKIKRGDKINIDVLKLKLLGANTFRKIRLAYALKFRTKDAGSIIYRVRNGKGYATDFSFVNRSVAKRVLDIVIDSIVKDISKNVKGKKVYIPDKIVYALPATEKQFTGDFPSGSYVTVDKDMIFGVYWNNAKHNRIDLDLSLMSPTTGKIGWDRNYRTDDKTILFSGDMTDASSGASELFYIRKQKLESFILFVNYFNYDDDYGEVPFKIMVGKEQVSNLNKNYMINPNNVVSIAKTKINQKQKMLGLIVTTTNECRFYFCETNLGKDITSSEKDFVEHSRKYLFDFYTNTISLNDILKKAGAKLVEDKEKCDIDLSPEKLEKDSILTLINKS